MTGDGVEQMSLAQAAVAVDEEGVELACRLFRHAAGGGVSHLGLGAHHEGLKGEGVVLAGDVGMVGADTVVHAQLLIVQDLHLKVGGKNIPQGFFDLPCKALFNSLFFEGVAAVQH